MSLLTEMLREAVQVREQALHEREQRWMEDYVDNKLEVPPDSSESAIRSRRQTFSDNLHELVRRAKGVARAQALLDQRLKEEQDEQQRGRA